jgi:flagellar protein FliS
MSVYTQQAYLETEILQADPLRLVQLLYQAAVESVSKARVHVREGDIAARCRQITRAMSIVGELSHSLDGDKGGEVAANLARLYDYMQSRLLAANLEQTEAPLAEVQRLLVTLQQAWNECGPARPSIESFTGRYAGPWATEESGSYSRVSLAG